MDEIDSKQQSEINELQKKDITHDAALSLLNKIYVGLFVIVLALFVGAVISLPIVSSRNNELFNCPHENCIHHNK